MWFSITISAEHPGKAAMASLGGSRCDMLNLTTSASHYILWLHTLICWRKGFSQECKLLNTRLFFFVPRIATQQKNAVTRSSLNTVLPDAATKAPLCICVLVSRWDGSST